MIYDVVTILRAQAVGDTSMLALLTRPRRSTISITLSYFSNSKVHSARRVIFV
jgi:hypothetical protein